MAFREPDFTEEAKALSYYPFIRLSPLEYLAIRNLYGAESFTDVLPRLQDPGRLHAGWAARFVGAARTFSSEELSGAEDLYAFVTSAAAFSRRRPLVRAFERELARICENLKSGEMKVPEEELEVYLKDLERSEQLMEARNKIFEEQKKRNQEKKAKRQAHEKEMAAAKKRKEAPLKAEKPKEIAPRPARAASESKPPQPSIERKAASKPQQKSTAPNSKGVWRNPHSIEGSIAPRTNRQDVTIIRKGAK